MVASNTEGLYYSLQQVLGGEQPRKRK
ncbi:uncharacterized protein G2W53_021855 [Senna tora]|uniref:Uncharacterized protein n=1 Tax=Senna tora TaxID=362788 RepID=A0A834TMH8_9FABA|nr:uncharacterized protein G2W53_021855 [Senna tora]